MKRIVLLIAAISIVAISFAENTNESKNDKKETAKTAATVNQSVITGQIVDEISGEALVGVKVSLVGSTQEVYTDFDGNFSFTAEKAEQNIIKTDYISYKTTVHKNVNSKEIKISLEAL